MIGEGSRLMDAGERLRRRKRFVINSTNAVPIAATGSDGSMCGDSKAMGPNSPVGCLDSGAVNADVGGANDTAQTRTKLYRTMRNN